MQPGTQDMPRAEPYLLPRKRWARVVLVVAVYLAALGVRAARVNCPLTAFDPEGQYRCALIARSHYIRSLDSSADWERRVADSTLDTEFPSEPPIMEFLVVIGYHVAGAERLWIPRAIASVCWIIGGMLLYAIARRMATPEAALLVTVFYLFVPFGVVASTAFQPDCLMLVLLLASVLMVVRYADRPSLGRLFAAAGVSAIAVLVTPLFCLLPLFGAFLALAMWRRGLFRGIVNPRLVLFGALSVLPAATYIAYNSIIAGFFAGPRGELFLPYNTLYVYFWRGWLARINETVGPTVFAAGLLGAFGFRDSFSRALALGLWAGYFLFGLAFNCGVYIHDCYQIMLIPIAGLSMAPFAEIVVRWLRRYARTWRLRAAAGGVLVLAIAVSLEPLFYRSPRWRAPESPEMLYEEIGKAVNHSTRVLVLADARGEPLKYHGRLGGRAWPRGPDPRLHEMSGRPTPSADKRLDQLIELDSYEFFVVISGCVHENQSDLRVLLTRRYPVLRETDQYTIFDLRERLDGAQTGPEPEQ